MTIQLFTDHEGDELNERISKTKKSKIISVFNKLQDGQLIFPGAFICQEDLENAFGMQYSPENWLFRGLCLSLRMRIKAEGYFITDRGCKDPEFRIVHSKDMASFAEKRLKKNLWSNFEVAYVMAAADVNSLTEDEKKKHRAVQVKAAQTALVQQKMIMSDQFF